jgi:hypothetical protein
MTGEGGKDVNSLSSVTPTHQPHWDRSTFFYIFPPPESCLSLLQRQKEFLSSEKTKELSTARENK